MATQQAPRGMRDILPGEVERWHALEAAIHDLAARFGFREIRTPVVEHTEVFLRTVGEATDMVEKEMYTFSDRGGRSLSLRPEGTAGVMRAYLEHGLRQQPQPVKLYYIETMFRYDRPQKGRYRQHTQFGAEIIGSAAPEADAEVIALPVRLMQSLGLGSVSVHLNSVGDSACRPRYLDALRDYLRPRAPELCDDCRRRLEHNPLRVLDCKGERCRRIVAKAPASTDYLCSACADHLAGVREQFDLLGVPYSIDPHIVRGLDYYTRTAVEVHSGRLGAQSAMFGGGRYDGLAEQLGGPPTPGVGFGFGMDRLLLAVEDEGGLPPAERTPQAMVVAIGEAAGQEATRLTDSLRRAGVRTERDLLARDARAQLRHAHRIGAGYALILGESEMAAGTVTVRDMATGEQQAVPADGVAALVLGGSPGRGSDGVRGGGLE